MSFTGLQGIGKHLWAPEENISFALEDGPCGIYIEGAAVSQVRAKW